MFSLDPNAISRRESVTSTSTASSHGGIENILAYELAEVIFKLTTTIL